MCFDTITTKYSLSIIALLSNYFYCVSSMAAVAPNFEEASNVATEFIYGAFLLTYFL